MIVTILIAIAVIGVVILILWFQIEKNKELKESVNRLSESNRNLEKEIVRQEILLDRVEVIRNEQIKNIDTAATVDGSIVVLSDISKKRRSRNSVQGSANT